MNVDEQERVGEKLKKNKKSVSKLHKRTLSLKNLHIRNEREEASECVS